MDGGGEGGMEGDDGLEEEATVTGDEGGDVRGWQHSTAKGAGWRRRRGDPDGERAVLHGDGTGDGGIEEEVVEGQGQG